jgi:hypothetical protein
MDPAEFMSHVAVSDGCWVWTGALSTNGYGRHGNGLYAHRTAYRLYVEPIPDGLFVLHRCDNPPCVRPSHLYAGTHQDNMRDMRVRGRNGSILHPERVARGDRHGTRIHPETVQRGARHSLSKLTDDAVRAIRRRYPAESLTLLAGVFGVDRAVIYNAAVGRTWAHVTDVPPVKPSYRKGAGRARERARIEARGEEWPLLERGDPHD